MCLDHQKRALSLQWTKWLVQCVLIKFNMLRISIEMYVIEACNMMTMHLFWICIFSLEMCLKLQRVWFPLNLSSSVSANILISLETTETTVNIINKTISLAHLVFCNLIRSNKITFKLLWICGEINVLLKYVGISCYSNLRLGSSCSIPVCGFKRELKSAVIYNLKTCVQVKRSPFSPPPSLFY